METYKVLVSVKGIAPLLMNRFNDVVETSSKRGKKTYDPTEEAEKKSYRTEDKKLFLPATHFKASMVKAATDIKQAGKKTFKDFVKSAVFIAPEQIVLNEQQYEIHAEPVVIQRARVMSWRPKFKEWSCEFGIEVTDGEFISQGNLKQILESAGRFKGVGDHRPEYGRFIITSFKVIK